MCEENFLNGKYSIKHSRESRISVYAPGGAYFNAFFVRWRQLLLLNTHSSRFLLRVPFSLILHTSSRAVYFSLVTLNTSTRLGGFVGLALQPTTACKEACDGKVVNVVDAEYFLSLSGHYCSSA